MKSRGHFYHIVVAISLFLTGTACSGETTSLEEATRMLKSQDANDIVKAAQTIAPSNDERAWEALAEAASDSSVIAALEKPGIPRLSQLQPTARRRTENGWEAFFPEMADFLNAIAAGPPDKAISLLTGLTKNDLYAAEHKDLFRNGLWRRHLIIDAFRYIRKPNEDLLNFLDGIIQGIGKAKSKGELTFETRYRMSIAHALLAYATPESIALFEKNHVSQEHSVLPQHRDRYECLKLLIEIVRKNRDGGAEEYANQMLENMFVKELPLLGKEQPPVQLPAIEPKGEEAVRIIALLKDFLANPGKQPLSPEYKQKMEALIEKIEKTNAPSVNQDSHLADEGKPAKQTVDK